MLNVLMFASGHRRHGSLRCSVPASPTVRFGQDQAALQRRQGSYEINRALNSRRHKVFQETLSVPLVSHRCPVAEASPGAAAALRNIAHL